METWTTKCPLKRNVQKDSFNVFQIKLNIDTSQSPQPLVRKDPT